MSLTRSKVLGLILVLVGLNILIGLTNVSIVIQRSFADKSDDRDESSSGLRRVASGIGLRGEYFDHSNFTDLKFTRVDSFINFNWGNRGPHRNIGKDTFSVRWTGQIKSRFSETYTFDTIENNGIRVWINDESIINNSSGHPDTSKSRGKINLIAGRKYNIKIEYFELTGNASVRFLWSSPSQRKEIVPPNYLFPTQLNIVPTPSSNPLPSPEPSASPSVTPQPEASPPPTETPTSTPTPIPTPIETPSSISVMYLRPMSDSLEQDWECFGNSGLSSVHYQLVNEEQSDDSATYCRKDITTFLNSERRNIYKLSPVSNLGTITNVSVVARARKDNLNNFPVNLKIGIRNPNHNLAEFDGGQEFPVDNLWRDYEVSFGSINPATGVQWTLEDINNLEVFHKLGSIPAPFGEKLVVTQIYLKIEYTPPSISFQFINYLGSRMNSLFGSIIGTLVD